MAFDYMMSFEIKYFFAGNSMVSMFMLMSSAISHGNTLNVIMYVCRFVSVFIIFMIAYEFMLIFVWYYDVVQWKEESLIMGLNENIIRSAVSVALQAVDGRNDLSIIHIYAGKDGDVNVMYDFNDGSEYGIYDLLSIGQSKKVCNDILYALDTDETIDIKYNALTDSLSWRHM